MAGKGFEAKGFASSDAAEREVGEVKQYLAGIIKGYQEEIDSLEHKLKRIESGEEARWSDRMLEMLNMDAATAESMRRGLLDPKMWQKQIDDHKSRIARVTSVQEGFKDKDYSACVAFLAEYAEERKRFWALPLLQNAEERMRLEQERIRKYISFLQ